jgi:hypothetical protein
MNRKAILLNVRDNVATALTDLKQGEVIVVDLDHVNEQLTLQDDVQLGHKVALHDIEEGDVIVKYGMPIGRALQPIRAGEWVHVHNCRSHHWGFQNEKYGLQA